MESEISSVHVYVTVEEWLKAFSAQKVDRTIALLGQRCGDVLYVHNATVVYPAGLQDSVKALKHLEDVLVAGLRVVGICMTNSYTFRETMVDLHSLAREIDREFRSTNQHVFLPFVLAHLDKRSGRLSCQKVGPNLQLSVVDMHASKTEPMFAALRAKYPIAAVFPLPVTSMEQDVTDTLHRCVERLMLTQDDDGVRRSVSALPLSSTTAQRLSKPARNLLRIANYTLHKSSIVAPVAAAYGGHGIWPWAVCNSESNEGVTDQADLVTVDSMQTSHAGVSLLGYSWAEAKFMPRLNKPGAGYPVAYGEVIEGGSAAIDGFVHLYCMCGEQEPAERIVKELERDAHRALHDSIFWGLRETMAGGVEVEVKLPCRQWFLATTSARRDFPLLLGLAEPSNLSTDQQHQQQLVFEAGMPTLSKLQREFDLRVTQEEKCVHTVMEGDALPLKFRVVNESSEFVIRHPVAVAPKHATVSDSVIGMDDELIDDVLQNMITVKKGTEFGDQLEELRRKSQASRDRIEKFARDSAQAEPPPCQDWCRFSNILDKVDEKRHTTVAQPTKLIAEAKRPTHAEGIHFSDLDELPLLALNDEHVAVTRKQVIAEPNLFVPELEDFKAPLPENDVIMRTIHQRKESVMFWKHIQLPPGRVLAAGIFVCIAIGFNVYSHFW